VPIFKVIPVPKYICSGGILNDNFEAFIQLKSNATLIWIYVFALATVLPALYLAFWIIKNQSAMQKCMAVILKLLLLWVFWMIWPGQGHEDFNFIKMLSMILLTIGIVYYM